MGESLEQRLLPFDKATGLCVVTDCVNGPGEHPFVSQDAVTSPGSRRACRMGAKYTREARNVRPLRDDPIEENEDGGKQSVIHHAFCSLPLRALDAISQLQKLGDNKYGAHNWRNIPENDHLDHAFAHLMGDRLGDETEDHLLHAAWRLLAALEQRLFNKSLDAIGGDDD